MGGIISEEPEKPALTAQSTVETVDSGPTAVSPPSEQLEDIPGEPRHSRHSIMIPRDTRVRASQTVSERPSDATESDGEQDFPQPRHSRASLMISEVLQMRASLAVESLGSDDLLAPDRDSPEQSLVLPRGSQARSRHSSRISVSSPGRPKPMGVGLIRT